MVGLLATDGKLVADGRLNTSRLSSMTVLLPLPIPYELLLPNSVCSKETLARFLLLSRERHHGFYSALAKPEAVVGAGAEDGPGAEGADGRCRGYCLCSGNSIY